MQWFPWARCGHKIKGHSTGAVEHPVLNSLHLISSLQPSKYLILYFPHYNQFLQIRSMVFVLHGRHHTKHFVNVLLFSSHKNPSQGLIRLDFTEVSTEVRRESAGTRLAATWLLFSMIPETLGTRDVFLTPVGARFLAVNVALRVSENTTVWGDLNEKSFRLFWPEI